MKKEIVKRVLAFMLSFIMVATTVLNTNLVTASADTTVSEATEAVEEVTTAAAEETDEVIPEETTEATVTEMVLLFHSASCRPPSF